MKCVCAVFLLALASGCARTAARETSASGSEPVASQPPDAAQPEQADDLTLDQALRLAAGSNPELAEARHLAEAAEARAEQAGRWPNPELSARMEAAPFGRGTTTDADYLLGLAQALPLGGRLGDARRAQQQEARRIAAEARVREFALTRKVRAAFAETLYFDRLARLRERVSESNETGLKTALARLAAGEAAADEVARARLESLRASAESRTARARSDAAKVALSAAIGRPRLAIRSVAGDLEAAMEIPALEDLDSRLKDHPSLLAAEAELASFEALRELARSERIPDLTLDVGYRYIGDGDTHAFDIGLSVELPLLAPGRSRIREAEANLLASRERARASKVGLEGRLRPAILRLTATLEAIRMSRESLLPAAAEVLRVAESRFAAGDASALELAIARRENVSAEFELLELLRESHEAWGEVQEAIR